MKIKIILSILLFSLAGYFIAAAPVKAAVNAPCVTIGDCSTGEWCNPGKNNTCQYIVAGTPCSGNAFCSAGNSGLTCGSNNMCVAAQPVSSGSTQSQPSASNVPSGSTAASSENCGDANLVMVNGLCLPINQFSGFANSTSLSDFLTQLIKLLLALAGVVGVVVLIVGGFWYITSAGNEEQSEKGKKAIINAIIGIVVVIMSYAIITILNNVLTQTSGK